MSPDDALKWGQEVKSFFESNSSDLRAEAMLTSAVDDFFNSLVSDMREG
jgi:hypothetical protein